MMRLNLCQLIYNFDFQLAEDSIDWFKRRRNFFTWERIHMNVHLTPVTDGY